MTAGRVIAIHGRHFLVETAEGVLNCVSRGKKGGITCNDRVSCQATGAGGGVIEQAQPRRNLLYRSDRFRSKLLAANIDQVLVVTASVPSPNLELLDRCLVAAEAAGIPARIVINKIDLPESAQWRTRLEPYRKLGYPLIELSARQSAEPLRTWLADKTSILVGASGVGKSTLLNRLVPEADSTTREISTALDTGKHTTSHTRLYHLPDGGELIDSPGMQEFGLHHIDSAGLLAAFPEFRSLAGHCRFHNCRHLKEPNCAILDAIADGRILETRWRSYRAMLKDAEAEKY